MIFAGQVGVIELVGVVQAFARHEFEIVAAERVAAARREIAERHFERAADFCLVLIHRAGEAVRRQPFCERVVSTNAR